MYNHLFPTNLDLLLEDGAKHVFMSTYDPDNGLNEANVFIENFLLGMTRI